MASIWIVSLLLTAVLTLCISETFVKYNDQTELCCNGAVSKKLSVPQRCCGAVAYAADEHLCCNQTLHPVKTTNDSIWACCYAGGTNTSASEVYNARTHQCCRGLVLEKPEAGAMYECCEGHLYSARTHECCNGSVAKLEQGFGCCGNQEKYDTLTKKCCRVAETVVDARLLVPYRLHDKDGLRKCCGLDLYDPQANYCCNQTVFPLPKDMLGQEDHGVQCCGDEILPSNLTHPLCHHDQWWGRNSTDYSVCGGQLFNFKEAICCGNQTLARTSGTSCCWGAELPYDQKTQACCGSQVVPLSKEDMDRGATSCCSPWRS